MDAKVGSLLTIQLWVWFMIPVHIDLLAMDSALEVFPGVFTIVKGKAEPGKEWHPASLVGL